MKLMVSPKNFQPVMRRPGQAIPSLTANQARTTLLENSRGAYSVGQRVAAASTLSGQKRPLDQMGSFFGRSSGYDKHNVSTTVDGTLASLQQQEVSLRTDVDRMDQAHNSMNLSLGKPTQSFAPAPFPTAKK